MNNQNKTQEYLNNITELENTVKKMEPKYKKVAKCFIVEKKLRIFIKTLVILL